jgi:23S rRNA pseudouridine2605 synthase
MKSESLLKILTGVGLGSRRKMADAIKGERVAINGQTVTDFRHPVNAETDQVSIDGRPVDLRPEQLVTLMLHKPKGVISTVSDERGRDKVTDLLPERYRRLRLYPAGRLDKDSTGLLLLTNDGELAYQLTHPRFEHEKEYLVQVRGRLSSEAKRKLERGIELEDGMTHPAKVRGVTAAPFNYRITIHEGRKRQLHRMLEALAHRILALKRIRMGNLELGDLPEGKTRQLSAKEVRALTRARPKPYSAGRSPSASVRTPRRRA